MDVLKAVLYFICLAVPWGILVSLFTARSSKSKGVCTVVAVSSSSSHNFSKQNRESIKLVAGLGVEGDAHSGTTVQHLWLAKKDGGDVAPNLRQVHLMHAELHDQVAAAGFEVLPGALGENITTRGIALLDLPTDTMLKIGDSAQVRVTGLRNPCHQIDDFKKGLLKQVLGRDEHGKLVRKSGIMGVVVEGGTVKAGDAIEVTLPPQPHKPLALV